MILMLKKRKGLTRAQKDDLVGWLFVLPIVIGTILFLIPIVFESVRFSFYDLKMEEIGFDEYIFGEGVCLIEWANLIEEILPPHYRTVKIEKVLEKGFDYRMITIEAEGELL